MPLWTASEESIRDRAALVHRKVFGEQPTMLTTSPSTIPIIGEHTDYIGGVVAVALTNLRVAVAASPRPDTKIHVRLIQPEGMRMKETTLETTLDTISHRTAGGAAHRLGGVAWTLINRQMLSRETQGFNITVVSNVPPHCGLGEAEAMATAFALGLQMAAGVELDAPLRARLAEVCTQSANTFADTPELRARHIAALRGHASAIALIEYADGSVTQAPYPREVELVVVTKPKSNSPSELVSEIRNRHKFLDDAAHAYGVDSLRALPDAPTRITDWLTAVHKVHGPDNVPSLEDAAQWLKFLTEETQRATNTTAALRSRRMTTVLDIIRTSNTELEGTFNLATEANRALAYLCESRGALAVRTTSPGIYDAVTAYVEPKRADNFAADLAADGLLVIPIGPGAPTV